MTVLQWIVQFSPPDLGDRMNDGERDDPKCERHTGDTTGAALTTPARRQEPSRSARWPNRNSRLMIVTIAMISGPVNSARNSRASYLRCM